MRIFPDELSSTEHRYFLMMFERIAQFNVAYLYITKHLKRGLMSRFCYIFPLKSVFNQNQSEQLRVADTKSISSGFKNIIATATSGMISRRRLASNKWPLWTCAILILPILRARPIRLIAEPEIRVTLYSY